MEKPLVEKLIIIGSGPAGLTAAIYSARAALNPLVISGREAGGQLMLTTDVDDFPGFEEGIQGPDLMAKMRKQAERFNTRFINEDVVSVNLQKKPFEIQSESRKLTTDSLIIATGASAMWLNLPSEQRLRGKGVSACAVCDGFFFKDKVVAVVGGGDTAMEEAIFLTKFSSKVYILVRGNSDYLKASKYMQNRARANPKIEFLFNTEVKEVLGKEKVTGLTIFNNQTSIESQLSLEGLFLAIGYTPNTKFLESLIELDEKGYAKIKEGTKSTVEGIFVSGDVADHKYRQAVTAAGWGCMAALDAEKYLVQTG